VYSSDLRKAEIVLDTMVTIFAEYCENPFQVEAVEVTQLDGNKRIYPKLSKRCFSPGCCSKF
jgi:phenylalanyl-tRNA synthetase beta chain